MHTQNVHTVYSLYAAEARVACYCAIVNTANGNEAFGSCQPGNAA